MKITETIKSKTWLAAMAGILTLTAASTSHAALMPVANGTPEIPGVLLGAGSTVADLGLGTVKPGADITVNFQETNPSHLPTPAFQGTLRSLVVLNSLGTLDFYLQLTNTSNLAPIFAAPLTADIFRLATSTFDGFITSVTYRTDGLVGITGASGVVGGKSAFSADRDPGIAGGVGIDFSATHFLGSPSNIDGGQTSDWIVIRTNATGFTSGVITTVSGVGTAFAASFAPVVPEPGTLLAGIGMIPLVAGFEMGRRRRRQPLAV